MGSGGSRSARQRRSGAPDQRRRSAALPASAARSERGERAGAARRGRAAAAVVRPHRVAGRVAAGLVPQHQDPPASMTFVPSTWQRELSRSITDPAQLLAELDLDPALAAPARAASSAFALRVTRSYLARMSRGDADDPLLRQVLPLAD